MTFLNIDIEKCDLPINLKIKAITLKEAEINFVNEITKSSISELLHFFEKFSNLSKLTTQNYILSLQRMCLNGILDKSWRIKDLEENRHDIMKKTLKLTDNNHWNSLIAFTKFIEEKTSGKFKKFKNRIFE